MSMINCPECGKEISDKASSCSNCGYPLQKLLEKDNKSDFDYVSTFKNKQKQENPKNDNNVLGFIAKMFRWLGAVFLLFIALALFAADGMSVF